jgi:hypothetical protein
VFSFARGRAARADAGRSGFSLTERLLEMPLAPMFAAPWRKVGALPPTRIQLYGLFVVEL